MGMGIEIFHLLLQCNSPCGSHCTRSSACEIPTLQSCNQGSNGCKATTLQWLQGRIRAECRTVYLSFQPDVDMYLPCAFCFCMLSASHVASRQRPVSSAACWWMYGHDILLLVAQQHVALVQHSAMHACLHYCMAISTDSMRACFCG